MKLSIVTATFNSERVIKRCLDSVAEQSAIDDIEHIVIDGGSTDRTLSIVSSYPHVKKILQENDRGIYHAFNRGISNSSGEIIFFLNSDDVLFSKNIISSVLSQFNEDAYFFAGKVIIKNFEDNQSYIYPTAEYGTLGAVKIPHQAFFCRRKCFDIFGLFNECFLIAADTYFIKKVVSELPGIYSEEVVSYFSLGGVSSSVENAKRVAVEDMAVDLLLSGSVAGNETFNKLTHGLETLKRMRTLFLKIVCNEFDCSLFLDKKVVVFGAHELSIIVLQVLRSKGISVIGLLVTGKENLMHDERWEVFDLQEIQGVGVELVVNCVEGQHENSVSDMLRKKLTKAEVISWREI